MQPIRFPTSLPSMPKMPTAPLPPVNPLSNRGVESASNPFIDLVVGKVQEVNSAQRQADHMVHQMLTGEDVNQAEVLTAVQKADMAFRMLLQMRNKLMDAYREIQQIQI